MATLARRTARQYSIEILAIVQFRSPAPGAKAGPVPKRLLVKDGSKKFGGGLIRAETVMLTMSASHDSYLLVRRSIGERNEVVLAEQVCGGSDCTPLAFPHVVTSA